MFPRCRLLVLVSLAVTGSSLPTTYDQQQTGDLNVHVQVDDLRVLALLRSDYFDDYTEYDYFYDYADFTIKPTIKPTTSSTPSPSEATDKVDAVVDSSPATTEKIDVVDSSSATTEKVELVDSFSATTEKIDVVVESSSGTTEKIDAITTESSQTITPVAPIQDLSSSNATAEEAKPAELETQKNETATTSTDKDPEESTSTRINDKTRKLFKDDDEDVSIEQISGVSTENPNKRLLRKRCKSGYSPDGKGRCHRQSKRRLSLLPLAMKFAPDLLDDIARKNVAQ